MNEEEIEGITMALDALLTAIAADREAKPGDVTVARSAAEMFQSFDWKQTEAQAAARRLVASPVGNALRVAVEILGVRLHEIGGVPLMQRICAQVADLAPESSSWREGLIDRRWDGIGEWLA